MARVAAVVWRPALVVLIVVALLLALLWVAQRRLIYLPDRADVPSVTEIFPDGQDLTLLTSDGLELGAWWVPPDRAGPDRELVLLFAPGNAGSRAGRAPLARVLTEQGFGVLLLDYRGYGGNPGRPTEQGLARDIRAAHDHLVNERGVPPERIIYFGESLGTGVVSELATEREPGGLVLRSPFTELAAVGATHYPFLPVRTLLRDRYPVTEHVAQVPVPTAVVYGSRDRVVPPELSAEVAEVAAGPVQVTEITGADHNDPEMFTGPELVAAVVTLADEVRAEPAGG